MTENEVVAELSANVSIVNYLMQIMILQIKKGEQIIVPQTNNNICDYLIETINEMIKENNELKSR